MKILFVIGSRLVSGAEDHLLDLAVWLRENGVEPVFFVRSGGALQKRLDKLAVKYHPVFDPERKAGLLLRIAKAILAEQPDVISINREHNIMPVCVALNLVRFFLKKRPKLVAVFHTPTGRWYPWLKKFDGIIATSKYTSESFSRDNPGIEEKTSVIHYGIKLPDAEIAVKTDRDRNRKVFHDCRFPVIGMAGELWKNQEELVDAAKYLVDAYPDITIAFIGGYEGESPLLEKIERSGLKKNFVLTGRLDRELMPDVFQDLDLSVSTHRNEGFGIVHIESLAGFTPVVAYNSGGLTEILRKGGGVLVDGGPAEFAGAVLDLLKNDDRRLELGREGRKVVEEHFSLQAMGKRHLNFYERVTRQ